MGEQMSTTIKNHRPEELGTAQAPMRFRRIKLALLAFAIGCAGVIALCLYINYAMVADCPYIDGSGPVPLIAIMTPDGKKAPVSTVNGSIYESPELAPPVRVAVVPGAAVYADGRPSQLLRERLETALVLYQAGKVRKILVSGNNQLKHNRESEIMRLWLVRHGVAQDDVQCDHAGFRTLDTCARMARVWNLQNEPVLFVSQRFHLPRTLYLARAWGLQPIGVSANTDGLSTHAGDHWRESIARLKAWLDVNILGTQPKFFGPPEKI